MFGDDLVMLAVSIIRMFALMLEAAEISAVSVNFFHTTQHNHPEDSHLQSSSRFSQMFLLTLASLWSYMFITYVNLRKMVLFRIEWNHFPDILKIKVVGRICRIKLEWRIRKSV
jgi:hypothetical protein